MAKYVKNKENESIKKVTSHDFNLNVTLFFKS